MALQNFKRGLSTDLGNTSVVDGTFRFTTDNSKLYIDDGQTRKAVNPNPDWSALSGNAQILNKPTKLSDFIDDIGAGSGGGSSSGGTMTYQDIVVTSVTATQSYDNYSYIFTYSQSGITANTYVSGSLPDGGYSGDWGVESATDSVKILFDSQPTTPLTVRVYAFSTSSQMGMSALDYSILSVTASNTYPGYPYVYSASLNGVSSNSQIDMEVLNDNYTDGIAIESTTNGINIYFAKQPTTFPVNVKVYVYKDVVNTTSPSVDYQIYSVTSVSSSNTYPQYAYAHTLTYNGIDATTKVDININPSDYVGNYAIESGTNSLTIYFQLQPTTPLPVKIQVQRSRTLIQS